MDMTTLGVCAPAQTGAVLLGIQNVQILKTELYFAPSDAI